MFFGSCGRRGLQGHANDVTDGQHRVLGRNGYTRRESTWPSPRMFLRGKARAPLLRETADLEVRRQCRGEDDGPHWVRSHCARQIREERFRLFRIATDMG